MSTLLNTGLDRESLRILVNLCEAGVNPEALAEGALVGGCMASVDVSPWKPPILVPTRQARDGSMMGVVACLIYAVIYVWIWSLGRTCLVINIYTYPIVYPLHTVVKLLRKEAAKQQLQGGQPKPQPQVRSLNCRVTTVVVAFVLHFASLLPHFDAGALHARVQLSTLSGTGARERPARGRVG